MNKVLIYSSGSRRQSLHANFPLAEEPLSELLVLAKPALLAQQASFANKSLLIEQAPLANKSLLIEQTPLANKSLIIEQAPLAPQRPFAISLVPVFFIAMIVLQACHSPKSEPEKEIVVQKAPTEVFLASKGKLSSSIKIPGELIAFQQVDIYAKVNSFIKKLNADVGSSVKAGELLALMEAPEINSQLAGANSRLQSMEALYIASKANYDRLLETSKTPGTISPNDLDIAMAKKNSDNAQWQSARSAYKEIADNKNYLEIRAPFAGVITVRNVSTGAIVGPSGKGSDLPLFTLQQQTLLRLTVAVPEIYTSYLNDRSEVSFTVKSFPNQKFTAKIKRLAGALDAKLRSERIEMDVDNKERRLLPGMIAEITIPLPAKDSAYIIPKTALVNSTEKNFIVKVVNGKAQRIYVDKGREADGKIEVYGNLQPSDTLLKSATEETRENKPLENLKLVQLQ